MTDSQEEPMAGIRIAIASGTEGYPEISPETDSEGYYRINSVPPGDFQVAAHDTRGQRIGLASVTVISGQTATINFSVPEAAAGELPSAKRPTGGLCLPAVPLAVSVGDTWTISGPVKVSGGSPGELPEEAAQMSSTFTVESIGTTTFAGGRDDTPIEHPTIQLEVTNVTFDEDGNVLSTEDDPRVARGISWTPASATNLGPVLTSDWKCHEHAWMEGWPSPAQPSIDERVLSSGVAAVVFSVSQPLLAPNLGIDAIVERRHGYDRLTGRVVLQEVRTAGTSEGAPFKMEMLMELATAGSAAAQSITDPGSCRGYPILLVSNDDGSPGEPAVVTSYQCLSLQVDSTSQYPSKDPSLAVTQGVPLSFRLQAERNPETLELRLYSGSGISGSFFNWPEVLSSSQWPVDALNLTPSLSFQYFPQQPPGEYSLVVRATWDGPIDVFYATSFRLQ